MRGRWIHVAVAGALFLLALVLRVHFFCGFVLGDDPIEFAALIGINRHGPTWADQLHVRFGGWVLNVAALKLFGVSESTLFLPTWIVSAAIPVIDLRAARHVRLRRGTRRARQARSSPRRRSRSSWARYARTTCSSRSPSRSAASCCCATTDRPLLQGVLLALCFWFGFYVKLWVVYFLPPLGIYYLRSRAWRAAASFAVASTRAARRDAPLLEIQARRVLPVPHESRGDVSDPLGRPAAGSSWTIRS